MGLELRATQFVLNEGTACYRLEDHMRSSMLDLPIVSSSTAKAWQETFTRKWVTGVLAAKLAQALFRRCSPFDDCAVEVCLNSCLNRTLGEKVAYSLPIAKLIDSYNPVLSLKKRRDPMYWSTFQTHGPSCICTSMISKLNSHCSISERVV